jgi:hypothetical protein
MYKKHTKEQLRIYRRYKRAKRIQKIKEWASPRSLQKSLFVLTICLSALSWYYFKGNIFYGLVLGLGIMLANSLRYDY